MAHADLTATFASFFVPGSASASWTKLGDNHAYSQLSSKYWGNKIEEEARELQHTVDVDRTNDIGPECYGLDLGIEHLSRSKLWVRQDYIRIYNYCSKRYEERPFNMMTRIPRSVVITGQPGVGKSYWVNYAVRRRLGEQKPFLWYGGGICFLFAEDGVFQQKLKDVFGRDFAPHLWAFIDPDGRSTGVPENLVHDTKLFIMFTTSPEPDRWKTLKKCTSCRVIIMNTWSLEEIRQAANLLCLTNEEQNLAVDTFERVGPIPRHCIDFVLDPDLLRDFEFDCRGLISGLTYPSLRRFVTDGRSLNLDAGSHMIFVIRRYEVDDLARAYLEPRSESVKIQLMTRISKLQRLEQIDLYHAVASVNSTEAIADLVYESLCHARLQEGITLTLKPAIKRKERKYVHWKFRREDPASNSMDLYGPEPVFFPPNIGIVYEELRSVKPNHLHVPKARNLVALDSFFILGQFLYLFQFTAANNHDIKKGIEQSLSRLENILPPKPNWRFVFITPPGCEVDVKATSEVEKLLEGVTLYSAHLKVEEEEALYRSQGPFDAFWRRATAATFSWFSRMFFPPNAQ